MKKLFPILMTLFMMLLIVGIFTYLGKQGQMSTVQDNDTQAAITLNLGHVQCPQCTMIVNTNDYAAQVATQGKTWAFDDIGCMIHWVDDKVFVEEKPKIWVYTLDSNTWIDTKDAYYQAGAQTPMGYGYGAYAKALSPHVNFTQMRQIVLKAKH